jgi:osmoprotectant transport system permease protein
MADFLRRNGGLLVDGLINHVVLTVIAIGIGFALSLLLTLAIVRWRRLGGPILATAGLLYTIPSLALFALLVPITGLSLTSAEIGLISYTLLILIRNMLAGLDGVPADVVEAADGLGHTRLQRLRAVELPLAMPLIVAGLRIATVTTIGLVMVTSVIGEGGLGQTLLRGFNLRNWGLVYASLIAMVALAIAADLGLVLAGRLLTPWSRRGAG